MNILYEKFPDQVMINNQSYRIVTDFREWIKAIDLIEDSKIPERIKLELLLQWYIDLPDDPIAAIQAFNDFLAARQLYNQPEKYKAAEEDNNDLIKESPKHVEPAFSYTEDAGFIFSDFLSVYHIDLSTVRNMHWWKFKVLFDCLPDESQMKQRIMYRMIDLSKIKDKTERKRIAAIKKQVALKRKKSPPSDFDIGDIFNF